MYKCFLIEPILGDLFVATRHEWPPFNYITGWRRVDNGEVRDNIAAFGIGAMWYATWYPQNITWENETEPHLMVMCPNGESTRDWDIDSRASNCTKKEDRLHRCWIRHGVAPNITVDKDGPTCEAGAGSIQMPNWHGYLRNGELVV